MLSVFSFLVAISNIEQGTFNYSLRNIPITSEKLYKKRLIEKLEDVTKRMRWKAHFFESGERNLG